MRKDDTRKSFEKATQILISLLTFGHLMFLFQLAKEEALNELHAERQKRLDVEQKCLEFSRKTAELEQRITELQNSRQVRVLPARLFVYFVVCPR